MNEAFAANVKAVEEIIKSEVNVKEIELVNEGDVKIVKNLKLNFKTLGKKYGKHMKSIQQWVVDQGEAVLHGLESEHLFKFEIDGDEVILLSEDVEIIPIDIPGWKVANEGSVTVALDVIITPELKQEGTAREIVNRIQNIRKEQDFEVTDRISVTIQDNEYLKSVVNKFSWYIRAEILAAHIGFSNEVIQGESVEIEEITTKIQVSKA